MRDEASTARRHLGGGAIAATASQVAVVGFGALASISIGRLLGPDGSGAFALAANLFAILLLLVGLGIKQAIVVFVGSGRWRSAAAVGDLALPLVVGGALGIALGELAWGVGQDGFLEGLPADAYPLLLAAIPFGLAWQWGWSLALGRERYEVYAILLALPTVLLLVVMVPLAAAFGVTSAIIGFAAAQVAAGVAAIAWALLSTRRADRPGGPESRRRRIREAYRFGLATWASELLQFVNFRFDLFFLSAYAATATVGVYSVAATTTAIGLILPQSLAVAVMPRTAALESAASRGEGTLEDAAVSDARASRHTLLLLPVSALLVGALVVVGIPLLYGSEFDDGVEYGLLLLPGTLLLGLAKVFSSVVIGRGYPRYTLYTVLLTVPLTVAAYLLVIPDAGATGAAIVSSASYALTALVTFLYFRRVTGISSRDALLPRADDLRAYPEVASLSIDYVRPLLGALRRSRRKP